MGELDKELKKEFDKKGLDADGFKEHHEGDEVSGSSGDHGDEGSYLGFIGDKSDGK